jgi:hypothetical protein
LSYFARRASVASPTRVRNVPTAFDAMLALPSAEFIAPSGSSAADLASALNPADFSAFATDLASLFDLGSFLTF